MMLYSISVSDILEFLTSIALWLVTLIPHSLYAYCGPLITFGLPCLCLKRSLSLCLSIYVFKRK